MPSKKNIKLLETFRDKVGRANAIFFVNYQGLTHKQLEEARSVFKDIDSEISIAKNTLVKLALKENNLSLDYAFSGPLALLFSFSDAIKTARALYDFLKKYNLDKAAKIKLGLLSGEVISEEKVIALANLPSREVLLGKFVNVLASPISKLVYGLNWNIQKLALVLNGIKDKKAN